MLKIIRNKKKKPNINYEFSYMLGSKILSESVDQNADGVYRNDEVLDIAIKDLCEFSISSIPNNVCLFVVEEVPHTVFTTSDICKMNDHLQIVFSSTADGFDIGIKEGKEFYKKISKEIESIQNFSLVELNTEGILPWIEISFKDKFDKHLKFETFIHQSFNELVRLMDKISNVNIESEQILKLLASIKKDTLEITSNQKNIYEYLTSNLSNQDELKELMHQISESLYEDIEKYLDVAFNLRKIQELENFIELENIFKELKKNSNWETKVKIGIPLINLIGIKIESENKFNLKRHLKKIKEKTSLLAIKYGV